MVLKGFRNPVVRLLAGTLGALTLLVAFAVSGLSSSIPSSVSSLDARTVQANVAEKLTRLRLDEARVAAAGRLPKPPKHGATPIKTAPIPPDANWPSGIIETAQIPLSGAQYAINNHWQGLVNGEHVAVFAGSLSDDPHQGVVVLMTISVDLQHTSSQVYLTPLKVGSLSVVATVGTRLTLRSPTGAAFAFDATSGTLSAA